MFTLYIGICEYGAEEELCEQLLILIPPDSSQPPTAGLILIHRTPMLITNKQCTTLHQCTNMPMLLIYNHYTKLKCTNALNNDKCTKCIAHQCSLLSDNHCTLQLLCHMAPLQCSKFFDIYKDVWKMLANNVAQCGT